MKLKLPSNFSFSIFFAGLATLISLLVGCGASAKDIKSDLITEAEFRQVFGMFSSTNCSIDIFLKKSEALGFKATWAEYDELEEMPLSELSANSLCLIALSSSFQAYKTSKSREGDQTSIEIGSENVFPKNKEVSELVFVLPKSLTPKSCLKFEGATTPYVISVKKSDGRLIRDIRRTDADEKCFVKFLNKKLLNRK
jgi:hypothetical protein